MTFPNLRHRNGHDSARALAPVRVVDNALRTYTPFTADDGYSFCYTWLNRLRATGHLYDTEERMYAMIDVWDDDADIVAEFQTDREGFNYLRRKLKFKWENRDEWKSNRRLKRDTMDIRRMTEEAQKDKLLK